MKKTRFLAIILGIFFLVAAANAEEENATSQPQATQNTQAAASSEEVATRSLSEEKVAQGITTIGKDKISLDLKGIEISELFRILSMKTGQTIVPSKNVSGRINIFLNNLSFEDALDIVILSQDLACERSGGIINIMTAAEYEKLYGRKYNEKRQFKTEKLNYAKPAGVFAALAQVKSDIGKVIVDEASGTIIMIDIPEKLALMEDTLKDLDRSPQTEIFDLQYAKPADIKTHLSTAVTQGAGEVYVDERSSKVLVSDLPDKMKRIRRMVSAFDAETKQVFLETEIIQITLKDEYSRGIEWEKIFREKSWDDLDFKGTFPSSASWTLSPTISTDYLKTAVGLMAKDNYTSILTFLQTFGDAKVISSPRIAVVNNQEAKILVGSREAYITQAQSQAESTTVTSESVEFIDVGVKLNIVPTINEDGFITMKIKPEISSVRETLTSSLGSKIPIVETSEAETTVKVRDGAMVMIAGLRKLDTRNERSGIPFLQRIPILKDVFGAQATLSKRTELVIFITPHIIRGDTVLAGTEPEKLIPADIAPEHLREKIISRIMSKDNLPSAVPEEPKKEAVDIKAKAKGLKEY